MGKIGLWIEGVGSRGEESKISVGRKTALERAGRRGSGIARKREGGGGHGLLTGTDGCAWRGGAQDEKRMENGSSAYFTGFQAELTRSSQQRVHHVMYNNSLFTTPNSHSCRTMSLVHMQMQSSLTQPS